jgi:hypothetical protein
VILEEIVDEELGILSEEIIEEINENTEKQLELINEERIAALQENLGGRVRDFIEDDLEYLCYGCMLDYPDSLYAIDNPVCEFENS